MLKFDFLGKERDLSNISDVLFESATEGLILFEGGKKILVANPAAEEMFGYALGEMKGLSLEELLPMDVRDKHHSYTEGYMEQPKKRAMGKGLDLRGKKKNGEEFPVEISLNHLVVDGAGVVVALVSDISTRRNIEHQLKKLNEELERRVEERTEELHRSQELYNLISRNFPNGTIKVLDPNFRYIFAEGRELFRSGITSKDLIGTDYIDRLPEEVRPTVLQVLKQVAGGFPGQVHIEYNLRHYELNCVPLIDNQGSVHSILIVEMNITPLKQAESEVRKALTRERELNEMKSRFVAMASHEFRTPLSAILSSIDLIKRLNEQGASADKIDKHVNRIKSSVKNLTSILNDFLSLEKLEGGLINPTYSELNLKELIDEVVIEAMALDNKNLKTEVELTGNPVINTDKNFIHNILLNLVSNAVKYSQESGAVHIHATVGKDAFTISVSDQGIGIPEKEQNQLFDRFFRASNVTNIKGTGLGLHIVKRYLDILKGEINFVSSPEKGTRFTIKIPTK